jgi:hypothetical protein
MFSLSFVFLIFCLPVTCYIAVVKHGNVLIEDIFSKNAYPGGRAVYGVVPRPLGCWNRGCESR